MEPQQNRLFSFGANLLLFASNSQVTIDYYFFLAPPALSLIFLHFLAPNGYWTFRRFLRRQLHHFDIQVRDSLRGRPLFPQRPRLHHRLEKRCAVLFLLCSFVAFDFHSFSSFLFCDDLFGSRETGGKGQSKELYLYFYFFFCGY